MRKHVAVILIALMATTPAPAKGFKSSSGNKDDVAPGAKSKPSFALGVDQATGGCEVRKVNSDSDQLLGFKLLGRYESEDKAKAAEAASAACKNGPAQSEKKPALQAAEDDCQKTAGERDSTLVGLLSGLASGASKESAYADCMKANGYSVSR